MSPSAVGEGGMSASGLIGDRGNGSCPSGIPSPSLSASRGSVSPASRCPFRSGLLDRPKACPYHYRVVGSCHPSFETIIKTVVVGVRIVWVGFISIHDPIPVGVFLIVIEPVPSLSGDHHHLRYVRSTGSGHAAFAPVYGEERGIRPGVKDNGHINDGE